ncbi:predicted bile acid beta-glucosidase [Chthonomonas calidirosea]|nr:predicted bile acid beta-glucosidase [Chthonomonas calidirosea]
MYGPVKPNTFKFPLSVANAQFQAYTNLDPTGKREKIRMKARCQLVTSFFLAILLLRLTVLSCNAAQQNAPQSPSLMALGGIGSGAVFLSPDASLAAAEPTAGDYHSFPPYEIGFLAARVRIGEETHAVLLSTQSLHDLPSLPQLATTRRFPIAHFQVPQDLLPVATELLAFSSFIPHDIANSTLPVACFVVTFHNPLPIAAEVSALISCPSLFQQPLKAEILPAANGFFGAHIVSKQGETAVLTYPQRGDATVTACCWNTGAPNAAWWHDFQETGDLTGQQQLDNASSPSIAICVRLTLAPHDQVQIPFAVAWHTNLSPSPYYAALFPNATAIAQRLLANWLALYALTAEWQDNLNFSNLPAQLLQKLTDSLQPLLTNATLDQQGALALPKEASLPPADRLVQRLFLLSPLLDLYPDLIVTEIRKLSDSFQQTKNNIDAAALLILSNAYVHQTNNLIPLTTNAPTLQAAIQAVASPQPQANILWTWAALFAAESLTDLIHAQSLKMQLSQAFTKANEVITQQFQSFTAPTTASDFPAKWLDQIALIRVFLPDIPIPLSIPHLLSYTHVLSASQVFLLVAQNDPDRGFRYLSSIATEPDNPTAVVIWSLLKALDGFRIDQIQRELWLLPSFPSAWPRLESPIFSANLWATLHYTPTARGEIMRFYVVRLFAPGPLAYPHSAGLLPKLPAPQLEINALYIPAPPPFPERRPNRLTEVHLSLAQRPLGFRLKSINPSVLCLQLDAPLQLSAGDELDIEVH